MVIVVFIISLKLMLMKLITTVHFHRRRAKPAVKMGFRADGELVISFV